MKQLCLCLDANVPILSLSLHSLSSADTKCWHEVELIYSYIIISSPVKLGDSFPLRFKHFSPFTLQVMLWAHVKETAMPKMGQCALLSGCCRWIPPRAQRMPAVTQAAHAHRELLAFQLLARISARFLHQLDDLIKLMRHVFTTFSQTRP